MEDISLVTEVELFDFLKMQEHLCKLVKLKTAELALIQHGRLPIGEYIDFDICESEHANGCIHVTYEEYYCGESSYDSYELPFAFLCNKEYPVLYKKLYEQEQRKLKERIQTKEKEKLLIDEASFEKFEKNEYARLKLKFDGRDPYD